MKELIINILLLPVFILLVIIFHRQIKDILDIDERIS